MNSRPMMDIQNVFTNLVSSFRLINVQINIINDVNVVKYKEILLIIIGIKKTLMDKFVLIAKHPINVNKNANNEVQADTF